MLKYRLIVGPILIAVTIGLLILDQYLGSVEIEPGRSLPPGLILLAVFLLMIPLAAREFTAIAKAKKVEVNTTLMAAAAMACMCYIYLQPVIEQTYRRHDHVAGLGSILIFTLIAALIVYSVPKKRVEGAIISAGLTCLMVIYMGIIPAFFLSIRAHYSGYLVAGVMVVAKCGDIGAFTTGKIMGKNKMIPWISPGKTWEGFAGGVVFSALAMTAGAWLMQLYDQSLPLNLWQAAIVGAVFCMVWHVGDLMISLIKRDAGIKDSGKSIPGFGGVLDIIDSPLPIAPLAYWILV